MNRIKTSQYVILFLLINSITFTYSQHKHANVHNHKERLEDGAFSPRDHAHFEGGEEKKINDITSQIIDKKIFDFIHRRPS
jgi:hypothetical protein